MCESVAGVTEKLLKCGNKPENPDNNFRDFLLTDLAHRRDFRAVFSTSNSASSAEHLVFRKPRSSTVQNNPGPEGCLQSILRTAFSVPLYFPKLYQALYRV